MRYLRLFRRGSPNGQPLKPAPRCLSRGTRRAFSFAGAERTVRREGLLFRAFPSQTPSRERSARCNANWFEELACVLTPSNKEGGTKRRLLREADGRGVVVSVRARAQRRGTVLERRSLRPAKSVALCGCCAGLLLCLRSHRSGSLESNLCDGAVDRGLGQLRSDAIAYLLSGVFHCAERTKEADCHWKGMACCCVRWNRPCRFVLVFCEF